MHTKKEITRILKHQLEDGVLPDKINQKWIV